MDNHHQSRAMLRMTEQAKPDYSQRQVLPDLIRVWALIGIVLVNVGAFAWPLEQLYFEGGLTRQVDKLANTIVSALFMAKSYALFSLMFGMGLAFQINSALRKGVKAGPRHARRMSGLFLIGVLHASFFYIGDVLMTYAIMGGLLYAFRLQSIKALTVIGISLLVLQAAIYFLFAGGLYLAETVAEDTSYIDELAKSIERAHVAFGSGTFIEATSYRISMLPLLIVNGVLVGGASIFGYFLLGLAIVKKGYIHTPNAVFWKKCRWVALPIGLLASIFAAIIYTASESTASSTNLMGIAIITLAAPLSAFGYAGLIAKYAAGRQTKLKTFLARAGTATLSAYLLQSVILSLIFSAYGLGLFGQLGAANAILIGLATGIASLVFVSCWRLYFPRGPAEIILRRWTYLGKT